MSQVKSFAFYDSAVLDKVVLCLKQMKREIKVFDKISIDVIKDPDRERWFVVVNATDYYDRWLREFLRLGYRRLMGLRYRLKDEHERINLCYSCRPFKGYRLHEYYARGKIVV